MVKRFCDGDEWYPVFTLREEDYGWDGDKTAEFTQEELDELDNIEEAFDAWQRKIAIRFGYSHTYDGEIVVTTESA